MGIKSTMSAFLHRMFAPVRLMPLSGTWQHLSVVGVISAVSIMREIVRGNQKQVCSNHAADSRLSEWGNSSCASRYKGVTANLFQVQNSEFRSGTMQEKVNLYPCSLYIKKKDNCQNSLLAHRPRKCHSAASFFSYSSASHIFLIILPLFYFHYCRPAPSQAPPSVPASVCGAVPVPSFCMPPSCLSNLPELFKTLSPLRLFFFFYPTRQVNCTNLRKRVNGQIKITFTVKIIYPWKGPLWLQFLIIQ